MQIHKNKLVLQIHFRGSYGYNNILVSVQSKKLLVLLTEHLQSMINDAIYSWGYNDDGQLGIGSFSSREFINSQMRNFTEWNPS